jgi:adenosylcobinamide amidohydrolase
MVKDFELVSKSNHESSVTVIATAGCTHAESAGEPIEFKAIEGTINIIVLVEGNPTDSCLSSLIITATEAKTAALRDLDLRSRWSGDEATGTITDAIVAAKTGQGPTIQYGGPASNLGQLVAYCTRKAVKNALKRLSWWISSEQVNYKSFKRGIYPYQNWQLSFQKSKAWVLMRKLLRHE